MFLLTNRLWLVATLAWPVFALAQQPIQQDYPSKPIRIITATPGGTPDLLSRLIAPGLTTALGQQVIVENRIEIIAIETAARARPDGYTLFLSGAAVWLLPFMRSNVSWDPVTDFLPITLASTAPNILVVHPSLPVNTVKELISLAKARPGGLHDANAGFGTSSQLSSALFKAMTGVNVVAVPYKGTGQALTGLMGGEIQLAFTLLASAMPHVKSGKLRALAVTSAEPSRLAPDLPTVAASGVPGYEAVSLLGIFAPAKTPATIMSRLNQEIVQTLKSAEVKERLFAAGAEVVASSAEELTATIKSEMTRMGKVIKDAGIRTE